MPDVSVPVLSNIRVRPRASVSSEPPPFTITPRFAAREIPPTIAIGTARIKGHGVATTSTDSQRIQSAVIARAPNAITSVTGTKTIA